MNDRQPRRVPYRRATESARRGLHWITRHRRIAALQVLRGASYGAGTTVVSLIALWIKTRY